MLKNCYYDIYHNNFLLKYFLQIDMEYSIKKLEIIDIRIQSELLSIYFPFYLKSIGINLYSFRGVS